MPESTKEGVTGLSEGSDIGLGPGDRAFESYYSAPLKSMISEGPFSSLIPAAQNLSRLTLSIYTGGRLGLSPQ